MNRLQNKLLWENTNVQFSYLFLFWLLYPNVSKTDTLSSAKSNFSLQIKLQPVIHLTFTKWQPLDYNLLLLPSHTGTGGNSIKEQTVQWQLCAARADPSFPLLSDMHTHTGSSETVRGRMRFSRLIYCNTQELGVLNTPANQDIFVKIRYRVLTLDTRDKKRLSAQYHVSLRGHIVWKIWFLKSRNPSLSLCKTFYTF